MLVFAALCSLVAVAASHPTPEPGSLPARWFRSPEENHPVHKLFARQSTYPAVGSAEWTKKYPPGKLTVAQIPAEWTTALSAAIAAGKIPSNCPVATSSGSYTNSSGTMNAGREPICSSAAQCRGHDQIYDVPDGIAAISFDDGPLPASKQLHAFLRQQKQKVTHFYIGSNILANPALFTEAFETNGDDIAVHTWSHPHMPRQTNEMVLAELGWTMQIIHDSTGGRLPRYWRPPYGESDNRVRAIAKEIFGLTTVIWNDDTDDWNIGTGQTIAGAKAVLTKAYTRASKSPGLNILEHELMPETVQVFIDTYPLLAQNGWIAKSIPDAMGASWYLNAADNTSPVTDRAVAGGATNGTVPAASSSAAASGTVTATSAGTSVTSVPSTGSGGSSNGALRLNVAGWLLGASALGAAIVL